MPRDAEAHRAVVRRGRGRRCDEMSVTDCAQNGSSCQSVLELDRIKARREQPRVNLLVEPPFGVGRCSHVPWSRLLERDCQLSRGDNMSEQRLDGVAPRLDHAEHGCECVRAISRVEIDDA
jgi:hypothetical protein